MEKTAGRGDSREGLRIFFVSAPEAAQTPESLARQLLREFFLKGEAAEKND